MKKIIFLIAVWTIFTIKIFAQGAINHPLGNIDDAENQIGKVIKYKGHRNYSFSERSDLRVYMNGRYVGLQSKQVGAFIIPSQGDKGLVYEGDFYVNQDTNKNNMQVALGIHEAIPSSFIISDDGKLTMIVDNGYPSFRSFPAYSAHNIKKGDVWQAQAVRAVDPLSKGIITKMPIFVQYTYTGDDYFNGEEVYLISAQWATRYGMNSTTHYIDWGGDKELEKAVGSHKATLIVSKESGAALVIRDNVDEIFYYTDGNSYQFKGTISLFTEYPPAVDRSRLIEAIRRIVKLEEDEAEALIQPVDSGSVFGNGGDADDGLDGGADAVADGNDDDSADGADGGDAAEGAWADGGDAAEGAGVAVTYGDTDGGDAAEGARVAVTYGDTDGGDAAVADGDFNDAGKNDDRPITVENTEAGIRLTIQNLQFKADSAELLQGEETRLNQIAEILKAAEKCQFLIEGHTASTGYEEGELKLSIERADSIAEALSRRGIARERFICRGSGGRKPVAPNTSAEGKAKNRRVEITI
ncbi:MAG: OmpA family protein, partial [Treponema sp.]|uniref:OmpA family protein n=1 Tax=Treponema sp. TaxID=166 RepID=UPI0025DCF313